MPCCRCFVRSREAHYRSDHLRVVLALRVLPAVLRRILPFSTEAKQIWATRSALSKECDFYAWQKLFWISLGLLLYATVGSGLRNPELALMLFCLIGDGAGLLAWRRSRALTTSLTISAGYGRSS